MNVFAKRLQQNLVHKTLPSLAEQQSKLYLEHVYMLISAVLFI